MNLQEVETLFKREDINIKCKYDDKDKRLYFSGIENFTIYLQELENKTIFVRVWKAWNKDNPLNKQEQKDMNGCKMVKFKILKLLHKINGTLAGGEIKLEELPNSPEDINLNPNDNNLKSILDLDL